MKDKGSVLLNYSFGRSFAPIEANMKTQSEKSGKLIINRKDIENEIKKHLIATTSLLSFEPQHIDAVYSKRIKKEIPAVFEGVVQTNAGFKVSGDISITPRSINVYASDVVLDTLKEIKTIYTEIFTDDLFSKVYYDKKGFTIYDVIKPVNQGIGYVKNVEVYNLEKFGFDFLAGDPKLALFEDTLASDWSAALSGGERGIRTTLTFNNLIKQFDDYDYVFFDMGPSLGAINRSILLSCDYFVTPNFIVPLFKKHIIIVIKLFY